jgi:uncharacterized SAM-binding protein YcdF (DUF218 family)
MGSLLMGTDRPAHRGRSRAGSALLRAFGLIVMVAVSAFAGGFFVFADRVADAPVPKEPHADGIVALTGGAQRIEDATALLEQGSAARLLISGVNEATSAKAIASRIPDLARLLRCCVDIGREAHDTRGNALEAREWARRLGYDSLIVVTSAWHMPRSLTELSRALPGVTLVPYPVNPDGRDYARWKEDPELFKLLVVEYAKYVVARFA